MPKERYGALFRMFRRTLKGRIIYGSLHSALAQSAVILDEDRDSTEYKRYSHVNFTALTNFPRALLFSIYKPQAGRSILISRNKIRNLSDG